MVTRQQSTFLSDDLVQALCAAANDAVQRADHRSPELKRVVFDVVDALRAHEMSPRDVMQCIQTIVKRTVAFYATPAVADPIVWWVLERFYSGSPPPVPPLTVQRVRRFTS